MNHQNVYPTVPSAPDFDDLSKPQLPPQPAGYMPGSQSNEFSTTPNQFVRPIPQPTGSEPMFYIQPYPGPAPHQTAPPTGPPPAYQPAVYPPTSSFQPFPGNQPPYPATNLRPGPPIDSTKYQHYVPQQTATGYWAPSQPPTGQTLLVDRNAFDSSARFNQGAAPVIPPCPPGVAPTIHQIAAAKGQAVVLGKKKGGFFFQKGAGSTFW